MTATTTLLVDGGDVRFKRGRGCEDDNEEKNGKERPFRLSDIRTDIILIEEDGEGAVLEQGIHQKTPGEMREIVATGADAHSPAPPITPPPMKVLENKDSQCPSRPLVTAASTGKLASTVMGSTNSNSSSQWLINLLPDNGWRAFLEPLLHDSFKNKLFARIEAFLNAAMEKARQGVSGPVYPPSKNIFQAFHTTPLANVKVILLGQDPYHQEGQAHGLSFSVSPGVTPPPSLRNMYQELRTDIPGFQPPRHGYLVYWAQQGVLLLNATLTVERGQPNSHEKCGWGDFTDGVIERLSQFHPQRLVFLLWGKFAEKKKKLINASRHVVLVDCHPSPLSAHRGWFGCKCFSRCNDALEKLGHTPIDWQLPQQVI